MLNVMIKAARRGESDWTQVGRGTWNPGEVPKLNTETLPAALIDELFSVTVGADDSSGKTTAEFREFSYVMEWHR